ncbi:alpha/beta hydrolase [Pseudochelatococcus contaminans]|uniref:Alpha-beta hydrolase superfamily lysophospholipase n=1 Tax=Pseudochelatococcus contaminans TaxID=1538103 RepID=A0A7W6EET2_9HYPH|nr:alpha/beta hydrolase [Pseudochelatococcus contaminans]MBB3808356.1 alpha-beta hydrolase superfamily lysophospholipase [Pseudochelatococcus contaminans]
MLSFIHRQIRRILTLLLVVFIIAFLVRGWDMRRSPPLELWHTTELADMSAADIDRARWDEYLQAEAALFDKVASEVVAATRPRERTHFNRYSPTSPVYPGGFEKDWNRSFVLLPDGEPVGAVVLLHGLTDAPYSLRHVGAFYRDRGFAVVGIRLPGHGTVPGSLQVTRIPQWQAAVRLAVREARRLAGDDAPLHMVGYSNGGALALDYAVTAASGGELARPDQLVLLSPMVGITPAARFTWLAGVPAIIPAFGQSAWLTILPEFNPFKYNSMPVAAGQQSFDMTQIVKNGLRKLDEEGRMGELPPILTFQSVFDFTVSTPDVIRELYARLPANGSELVLLDADLNIDNRFGELVNMDARAEVLALLPPAPRLFRTVLVTNRTDRTSDVIARITEAGVSESTDAETGLSYPPDVYSLSHVGVPFPLTDGLYGLTPDPDDDFGIRTSVVNTIGEVNTFVLTVDPILRMTSRMQSNPFFPLIIERIGAVIEPSREPAREPS